MRVDKPEWVSHEGQSLLSVDVHPDGSRVATAGQDGKVKLWSVAPILDPTQEADARVPRLLATLTGHFGAVNCARWSADGRLLASGSDDNLVMLWRLAAAGERFGSSVPFGASQQPNVEKWRCVSTLRGHTGDVVDVAWAPDSCRLATVSLDNSVRVWDVAVAEPARQLLAVLQGHRGMVKGVGWDPIDRYLATQGDDRAVLVWEKGATARDWQESARIEEPFERSTNKTLFRRLSWSPDGQFLCCPHAFKKPMNIAVVMRRAQERGAWVQECDFVGHQSPIVVAAFSPQIYTPPAAAAPAAAAAKGAAPKAHCCCAVGGQDCNLSVWLTSRAKPLVVVRDLFEKDVLDMAWSPDGRALFCVSMDGTLAALQLEVAEIGTPLPAAERQAWLQRLYGAAPLGGASELLENPMMLGLERRAAAPAAAPPPPPAVPNAAAAAAAGTLVPAGTLAPPGGVGADALDGGSDPAAERAACRQGEEAADQPRPRRAPRRRRRRARRARRAARRARRAARGPPAARGGGASAGGQRLRRRAAQRHRGARRRRAGAGAARAAVCPGGAGAARRGRRGAEAREAGGLAPNRAAAHRRPLRRRRAARRRAARRRRRARRVGVAAAAGGAGARPRRGRGARRRRRR